MSRGRLLVGHAFANLLAAVLVALPTLGGAYWFWSTATDGRSPSIIAWILVGIDLLAIAMLVGVGISKLLRLGEDTANAFHGILVIVVMVAGLLYLRSWTHEQQGSLAKALAPACLGKGVPQAAKASAKGPLRILVLDHEGHRTGWTHAGADWRAKSVDETALVACVNRRDELIETQNYRSVRNPTHIYELSRYANVVKVRVMIARSGKTLDTFELRDVPRELRETESENQGDLRGKVEFEQLASRMERYAEGV
jgi:hypothetical protein